ncbi:MAG: peptidoglycan-binding domain-containing protein [Caulobacteraceae bacterium]
MAFVHNLPEGVGIRWIFDLTFAVGPNCRNHPADVQLVQHAINTLLASLKISDDNGAPITSYLKRDGLYGPRTAAAIRGFQRAMQQRQCLIKADGQVDPSSPSGWTAAGTAQYTIVYLNRSHVDVYGVMMDEADFPEPLKSNVNSNRQVG